jgi:hypothetical protein
MWRIVEAEWRQTGSLVMLGLFPITLLTMWGIHKLSEGFLDPGLTSLSMTSLYPLMLVVPAVLWGSGKERRARLWAGLPVSRTRAGMGSAGVALLPWPLAVVSAGIAVALGGEPLPVAGLIAWGGFLLVIIAATWTADQAFGPKGMYAVGVGALLLAITFDGLAILVDNLLGGEANFEKARRPSTAFWAWMQEPGTSVVFYVVAILVLLVGLQLFRRRDLV